MFVAGSESGNYVAAVFPACGSLHREDYFKQELVTRRAEYIAKTSGTYYPWRVFIRANRIWIC
jgi:hypothetical protein